jgi:hypothetical protein
MSPAGQMADHARQVVSIRETVTDEKYPSIHTLVHYVVMTVTLLGLI